MCVTNIIIAIVNVIVIKLHDTNTVIITVVINVIVICKCVTGASFSKK